MEDCQTPETVNDNSFSALCVDAINTQKSELNVIRDENVAIEKEYEFNPNGDSVILKDNFLSSDSTADVVSSKQKVLNLVGINVVSEVGASEESCGEKEKTEISCEMLTLLQSQAIDVSASNTMISPNDKFEIISGRKDVVDTSKVEFPKSVGHNVNIEVRPLNVIEDNIGFEKEQEIEVHKSGKEVASAADILEESCTEKEKNKRDRDIHTPEQIQANNMSSSNPINFPNEKLDIEIIQEVVLIEPYETPPTCVEKEESLENKSLNTYRCESDSWTDDDESSTSDSSSSDSDTFFQEMCEKSKPKVLPFVKTKGELGLDDLPPIEDLVISINEGEMQTIGKIHAVVEKLVVIHSIEGMKALDVDSVLFLSHDQPLGRVFEVYGSVNRPFYIVRFNSVDEIIERGVKTDSDVFFAPQKNDITSYVFVEQLQNQKGSDASWEHNNEPPEEFLDYSDDEKEKTAKRQRRFKNRNQQFSNNSSAPAKRPLLTDDSSNNVSPPRPAPHWNRSQDIPPRISRPNPFQSRPNPFPPPASPSPFVCSLMSPVRMQNSFGSPPNHPPRITQPQNVPYRSSPQLFVSPYHQPPVFGQVAVLNTLSPALHIPSPLPSPVPNNIPGLIPTSHFSAPQNYFNQGFTRSPSPAAPLPSPVANNIPGLVPTSHFSAPQNYFNQAFPRGPSPATHTQRMPVDLWLSNRYPNSPNIPPSHPLTVQIPNMNSPPPMHQFPQDRGPMQQFVNFQNANFNEPFLNNNRNCPPGNMPPRFYHS